MNIYVEMSIQPHSLLHTWFSGNGVAGQPIHSYYRQYLMGSKARWNVPSLHLV